MSARTTVLAASVLAVTALSHTASAQCIDFDPPGAGAWPCCGVVFMSDGIRLETGPYVTPGGVALGGGWAEIVSSCNSALPGHSLWLSNASVTPVMPDFFGTPGVHRFTFQYEDFGGGVNLAVNGTLAHTFADFHLIPPAFFAGVGVNNVSPPPIWTGSSWRGTIILEAMPGKCIEKVTIAGQELCIDNLCAEGPCSTDVVCPGDIDHDGIVGFSDLLAVLSNWGPCAGCDEDLDFDDVVGFSDLLTVLSNWGDCP